MRKNYRQNTLKTELRPWGADSRIAAIFKYAYERPVRKIFYGVVIVLMLTGGLLLGQAVPALGLAAEVTVDSNQLSVGDSVQLSIAVTGTTAAEVPQLKKSNGLQIQYLGPMTQFQIVNWKRTESITFNYSISPLQPGRYTLGPYIIKAGSRKLTTNAVVLTVTGSGGSNSGTANSGANSASTGSDARSERAGSQLFLTLAVPRSHFYIGEEVPATIKLYVGEVKVDEISYPQLQQSQFVIGQMEKPEKTQEIVNGQTYQVLTFHTRITPVKTGEFVLGPVQLSCSVMVSEESNDPFSDFFQDYQKKSVTLQSKSDRIKVTDLPATGKPQNFSGGIGHYQMNVTATPTTVLQGDPITVKIRLTGNGNLETVAPPQLKASAGFKVYDAARKNQPAGDQNGKQGARFEQVVIPVDPAVKTLGPFSFSYFDPEAGRYAEITSAAIPLQIKPNPDFKPESTADGNVAASSGERLGHDLIYIKDSPGSLHLATAEVSRQPLFWLLQLVPLLAVVGSWGYRKRQTAWQADTPQARSLRAAGQAGRELAAVNRALEEGRLEHVLDDLHRIVREYLAEKYRLVAAGMTQSVVENLKSFGIDPEVLEKITVFFSGYDYYQYTGAGLTVQTGREFFDQASWIVQTLNRKSESRSTVAEIAAARKEG